jgi:hypothetical protein
VDISDVGRVKYGGFYFTPRAVTTIHHEGDGLTLCEQLS